MPAPAQAPDDHAPGRELPPHHSDGSRPGRFHSSVSSAPCAASSCSSAPSCSRTRCCTRRSCRSFRTTRTNSASRRAGAGLLVGAYAVGALLFAIPGGIAAARFGPKRAVLAGLAGMAVASLAFGFAGSAWALGVRPAGPGSEQRALVGRRPRVARGRDAARTPRGDARHGDRLRGLRGAARSGARRHRRGDRAAPDVHRRSPGCRAASRSGLFETPGAEASSQPVAALGRCGARSRSCSERCG